MKDRKYDPLFDMTRLYGALAEGIVRTCVDARKILPVPPKKLPTGRAEAVSARKGDHVIGHLGVEPSNFKSAARTLEKLGAATIDDPSDKTSFPLYSLRLVINGSEVAEYVAKRVQSGSGVIPPIDILLMDFVSCAAHLDLVGHREDEPFVGDDNMEHVLAELHHARYLDQVDGKWRWTRRAATAFQLQNIWIADDWVSDDEIFEGGLDDEFRAMIETMPQDVRDLRWNEEALWLMVSHRWQGNGCWGPAPRPGEHVDLVGGLTRAYRLASLLQSAIKPDS
jgi:hypothetical protein